MAWATIANVATYTGVTVTQDDVDRAQALIELFADTTETASDAGLISPRNLRLLTMAVSYQAGWASEHPDVYTSTDVTSYSQDGASAQQAHANAHLLAPLAKRCVDRLTWRLDPWRARPATPPMPPDSGSRDSAVRDDQYPWTPL